VSDAFTDAIFKKVGIVPERAPKTAPAVPAVRAPAAAPGDWESLLVIDGEGRAKATLGNVMTILSLAPECRGVLAYCSLREAPIVLRQPPHRACDAVDVAVGSEWTEQESTRIAAWIYERFYSNVSSGLVTEAMLAIAQRNVVHPVRDYLDALDWDGSPRVDRFFSTYCGSDDGAYAQGVARVLFFSAVARVRRPGCKVDTIVTLEGKQGAFKSTMLRRLFGDWFSDTPLPMGDKDKYQQLRGIWGYELAELTEMKGRDAAAIKAFASSPEDRYRPSFERRARPVPRQCIFVGTTNDSEYLKDSTGARRFWPMKVPAIDLAAVTRDRDQLWAEADARVVAGEPWWPSSELDELGRGEQDARYEGDPWDERLEAWLARPSSVHFDTEKNRHEVPFDVTEGLTMGDILEHGIGLRVDRHGKHEQERAAKIMRRAGWHRGKQQRIGGGAKRVRRWFLAGDALVTEAGDA
jgi:putative DNA primase/helicase